MKTAKHTDRSKHARCKIQDCGRRSEYFGYCSSHWWRIKKWGDSMPSRPISRNQQGAKNTMWRGGQSHDKNGRVLVYDPVGELSKENRRPHVYRYRTIMEKYLGRKLKPEEIVHHKNGIKNDDRIENLEIMTASSHMKLHNLERRNAKHKITP